MAVSELMPVLDGSRFVFDKPIEDCNGLADMRLCLLELCQ